MDKNVKKKPRKGSKSKQSELRLGTDKEKNLSFVTKGSKEEAEIKKDLSRKMDAIIVDFDKTNLNEFSKSSKGIYSPTQYNKTDEYNRLFAQQMILNIGEAFTQVDSYHNFVNAVGMYFAFACFSDIGRHPIKYGFGKRETIKDRLYRENPTYADQVMNAMSNDSERLPMSAECASLLYIKATNQAYDDMRKPNADIMNIKHEYDSYLKYLSMRCQQDGISREALHRTTKQIYALFEDDDAVNTRKLFEQTSGTFGVEEKPYVMNTSNVDENGKLNVSMSHVHMGEYIYPDDTVSKPDGFFSIRMPKSKDEYSKMMMADAIYLYGLNISYHINGCEGMRDVYDSEVDRIVENYAALMTDDKVFGANVDEKTARSLTYKELKDNLEVCVEIYKNMSPEEYAKFENRLRDSVAKNTIVENNKSVLNTNGLVKDIRNNAYTSFKNMYPELSPQITEEREMEGKMQKQANTVSKSPVRDKTIARDRFAKFGYPQGSRETSRIEVAPLGEDVRPVKNKPSVLPSAESEILNGFDENDYPPSSNTEFSNPDEGDVYNDFEDFDMG